MPAHEFQGTRWLSKKYPAAISSFMKYQMPKGADLVGEALSLIFGSPGVPSAGQKTD